MGRMGLMGLMGLMGMMMIVVIVVIIMVVIIVIMMTLYLLNPGCRRCHLVKVELLGVDNLVQVHVAIITLYDLCFRLNGADNLAHLGQFLLADLRSLVQQDDVAELYLLDDQVLNVLLVNVLTHQVVAVAELVTHTQRIHHGHDAVQLQVAVLHILRTQRGNVDNGLGNGCRFADAAGLDDDVVEAMHGQNVLQLLHQVHLQRAADAAVLQGYQRVVLLAHYSTLLYQVGVDVHLADVIDDNCKLNTLLILQDTIQQRGLTTAQITRQQQDGNILDWFHFNLYVFFCFGMQR